MANIHAVLRGTALKMPVFIALQTDHPKAMQSALVVSRWKNQAIG